jgi:hypothetical protein
MNIESNAPANERVFRAASYTLVFLMLSCVILTVNILIHNLLPDWHATNMTGILFLIVLDRLYTYRHLKSLHKWSTEWAIALGAQWIVIAVFSRLLLLYANGAAAFISDLSLIVRGYMSILFAPEFVITLVLSVTLWILSALFLELLDEIGLDMKWAWRERPLLVQGEAIPAQQRMVGLIFTTGIVLVILTAFTRLHYQNLVYQSVEMSSFKWSRFSGAEAGALLYFVFGLALLSLTRLMSLQTHWNRLRIPVASTNLPRQWVTYSLFFLLLLALIVGILPAGDSIGFFSTLGTLFSLLLNVFVFIAQLIMGIVFVLFSLFSLLFGKPPPLRTNPEPTPPPTPTPIPPEPILATSGDPFLELIKSILLWGLLIAILIYALVQFARQHERILAALKGSRVRDWLILAWQWLYKNVEQARGDIQSAITDGWQSLIARLNKAQALPRQGWISLRSLNPRQRVYFFYLAMIRRGGERGLSREPSQTPSEYAAALEKEIPEVAQDIDSITGAFVQARYSRHNVNAKDADFVKTTWGRIRRALQTKVNRD